MAQFISIPTQIVGQPNIIFNSDNVTSIVPPAVDTLAMTGGSSSGTTITVASTTGLAAGMAVVVTAGTGVFAVNTIVSSVTNGTTFVVSTTPTTVLSGATISAATPYCTLWMQSKAFRLSLGGLTAANQNANAISAANIINAALVSGSPAPICSNVNFPSVLLTGGSSSGTTITVASTAGLQVGSVVSMVSGSGTFASNTVVSSINANGTQFVVSAVPTTTLANAVISAGALTVTALTVV